MRRPSAASLALVLVALCIIGVGWQIAAQRKGRLSPPEIGLFTILTPIQKGFIAVGDWGGDVGRTVFHRGGTIAENHRLENEVDDLRGQTERLARYQAENQELRRLLAMPAPVSGTNKSAEVVGFDATDFSRSIELSIGTHSGVRPKDVVTNARGVVGQVSEVSPFTCRVLPLTDRLAGVGAMISRTLAKGILQGTGDRVCKLSYLDYRADVREGDLVVTSGDSDIFPRGLVLGHVIRVERDLRYSSLVAEVDPSVAFDRLSAVYVRVQAG